MELVTGLLIFSILALSFLYLYTSLVSSTVVSKRKAEALSLATNQMEYLKSLPYNSLAVEGGSIYAPDPIEATKQFTINRVVYTVKTNIEYVDNAFDGCGSYPNQDLKEKYCRDYPAPSGAPNPDTNAADFKLARVTVTDPKGTTYADLDTHISARVAETASTTGAFFVNVIDASGNPVQGATVTVTNSTINPNVNVSDTSDSNGIAIFYSLPVDTDNFDYVATASKENYSTLQTIAPSGSLQPNYPNQKIFTQLSSYVTLPIKPQGANSLLIESTDQNGNVLADARVYLKGGYKKYTDTNDTSYYFDNLSPDSRPLADSSGLVGVSNLVPGAYYACGDSGNNGCTRNGTTYYLAASVSYGGSSGVGPVAIPTYDASSPPATTYAYNGLNYLQKVRLIFTTVATMPRITSISMYEISTSSTDLSVVAFQLSGANLPCAASPASCSTAVSLTQGGNTYLASCTGAASGVQLDCTVNLTGITQGKVGLRLTANGQTLQIPSDTQLGAFNAIP